MSTISTKIKIGDDLIITAFNYDTGHKAYAISEDYDPEQIELMYGHFKGFRELSSFYNDFVKYDSRFPDPSKAIFIKNGYFTK